MSGRWRVPAISGSFLALLAVASPAGAHPFGEPPVAVVSTNGEQVVVDWDAAADDALVIGMAIGVLDDSSLERYLDGPVQTAPSAADERELERSAQLRDYLLEHIAVSQRGRGCDGAVERTDGFVSDGARVVYRCPEPIEVVDLRVSMLHDVHPAYRTFAVGEGPAPRRAVFTVEEPVQRWDFTSAAARSVQPVLPSLLAVAGLVAVGLVTVALRRRRVGGPSTADPAAGG